MAAAAGYLVQAVLRAAGIGLCRCAVRAVPVQAPFLQVSVHVVKAKGVGRCLAYGKIHPLKIAVGILLLLHIGREGCSGIISRGGSGAAGVLPFGLSGQTVGLARLLGQPLAIGLCVIPGNVYDSHVVLNGEHVCPVCAHSLVVRVKTLVLLVGDFRGAHLEGRYGDLVGRSLIIVLAGSALGAHLESAGGNVHHCGKDYGSGGILWIWCGIIFWFRFLFLLLFLLGRSFCFTGMGGGYKESSGCDE